MSSILTFTLGRSALRARWYKACLPHVSRARKIFSKIFGLVTELWPMSKADQTKRDEVLKYIQANLLGGLYTE